MQGRADVGLIGFPDVMGHLHARRKSWTWLSSAMHLYLNNSLCSAASCVCIGHITYIIIAISL